MLCPPPMPRTTSTRSGRRHLAEPTLRSIPRRFPPSMPRRGPLRCRCPDAARCRFDETRRDRFGPGSAPPHRRAPPPFAQRRDLPSSLRCRHSGMSPDRGHVPLARQAHQKAPVSPPRSKARATPPLRIQHAFRHWPPRSGARRALLTTPPLRISLERDPSRPTGRQQTQPKISRRGAAMRMRLTCSYEVNEAGMR